MASAHHMTVLEAFWSVDGVGCLVQGIGDDMAGTRNRLHDGTCSAEGKGSDATAGKMGSDNQDQDQRSGAFHGGLTPIRQTGRGDNRSDLENQRCTHCLEHLRLLISKFHWEILHLVHHAR